MITLVNGNCAIFIFAFESQYHTYIILGHTPPQTYSFDQMDRDLRPTSQLEGGITAPFFFYSRSTHRTSAVRFQNMMLIFFLGSRFSVEGQSRTLSSPSSQKT